MTFALEQWQFSGKLKKNQTLVTQTVCMAESASQQGRLSAAHRAERQKEKTGFGDRFLKQRCSVKMVCRAETKLRNNRVQRAGRKVILLPAMSATSQGAKVVAGPYLSHCKYSRWRRSFGGDVAACRASLWMPCLMLHHQDHN